MRIIFIIGTFLLQLVIAGLLFGDYIYLSTGIKSLLFSTVLYNVGIAIYTYPINRKIGTISWILTIAILIVACLKLFTPISFLNWWHIWVLQFIQIHLFFVAIQCLTIQKNRLHIVGAAFLITFFLKHLEIFEIPSLALFSFLCMYSALILVGFLYKSENMTDVIEKPQS